jgi:hypothetical protein
LSKIKITLNREAVRDLLKGEEMKAILQERATEIRNRCGDGYEQDFYVGKNRGNAMVWAATSAARKDNLANNTILKAVKG